MEADWDNENKSDQGVNGNGDYVERQKESHHTGDRQGHEEHGNQQWYGLALQSGGKFLAFRGNDGSMFFE